MGTNESRKRAATEEVKEHSRTEGENAMWKMYSMTPTKVFILNHCQPAGGNFVEGVLRKEKPRWTTYETKLWMYQLFDVMEQRNGEERRSNGFYEGRLHGSSSMIK